MTSDFIVGFPGETDADFEATMRLIDDVGFDNSFSVLYSQPPGHAGCDVSPIPSRWRKKEARLAHLQASIRERGDAVSRAMVGTRNASS